MFSFQIVLIIAIISSFISGLIIVYILNRRFNNYQKYIKQQYDKFVIDIKNFQDTLYSQKEDIEENNETEKIEEINKFEDITEEVIEKTEELEKNSDIEYAGIKDLPNFQENIENIEDLNTLKENYSGKRSKESLQLEYYLNKLPKDKYTEVVMAYNKDSFNKIEPLLFTKFEDLNIKEEDIKNKYYGKISIEETNIIFGRRLPKEVCNFIIKKFNLINELGYITFENVNIDKVMIYILNDLNIRFSINIPIQSYGRSAEKLEEYNPQKYVDDLSNIVAKRQRDEILNNPNTIIVDYTKENENNKITDIHEGSKINNTQLNSALEIDTDLVIKENKIKSVLEGTEGLNLYSLKYLDNNFVVTKYTNNLGVYQHYLNHQKDTFKTMQADEFINWYMKACDDVMKLTDTSINNGDLDIFDEPTKNENCNFQNAAISDDYENCSFRNAAI